MSVSMLCQASNNHHPVLVHWTKDRLSALLDLKAFHQLMLNAAIRGFVNSAMQLKAFYNVDQH